MGEHHNNGKANYSAGHVWEAVLRLRYCSGNAAGGFKWEARRATGGEGGGRTKSSKLLNCGAIERHNHSISQYPAASTLAALEPERGIAQLLSANPAVIAGCNGRGCAFVVFAIFRQLQPLEVGACAPIPPCLSCYIVRFFCVERGA